MPNYLKWNFNVISAGRFSLLSSGIRSAGNGGGRSRKMWGIHTAETQSTQSAISSWIGCIRLSRPARRLRGSPSVHTFCEPVLCSKVPRRREVDWFLCDSDGGDTAVPGSTSSRTSSSPARWNPRTRAAARDRSMSLPSTNGPRSVILTSTVLPLLRL